MMTVMDSAWVEASVVLEMGAPTAGDEIFRVQHITTITQVVVWATTVLTLLFRLAA